MHTLRYCVLALIVATTGCGGAPTTEPEPPPTPPDTSVERAATAVFEAYIDTVVRRKPREACRLLVGKAAQRHQCAARATIPREIRTAGKPREAVLVRDASAYEAQMHLSARVEPSTGSGGHLVAFLDRRGQRWLIKEVMYGHYG